MSNYTEADVKRDIAKIERAIPTSFKGGGGVVEQALARLKSAALEGTNVPGLVDARDIALDLLRSARASLTHLGDSHAISEHAYQEMATYLDDEPVGDDGGRIVTRAEAKVADLQAQVAELEAQAAARDEQAFGLRQSLDGATKRVAVLAGERDALRVQVMALRKMAISDAEDRKQRAEQEREEILARLNALSAPPSETTPEKKRPAASHINGCRASAPLPVLTWECAPGCPAAKTAPVMNDQSGWAFSGLGDSLHFFRGDKALCGARNPSTILQSNQTRAEHTKRCAKCDAETTPAPERCPCGHPPDRHWDVGCVDCTCMRSK